MFGADIVLILPHLLDAYASLRQLLELIEGDAELACLLFLLLLLLCSHLLLELFDFLSELLFISLFHPHKLLKLWFKGFVILRIIYRLSVDDM